jgi:hypothetical protein
MTLNFLNLSKVLISGVIISALLTPTLLLAQGIHPKQLSRCDTASQVLWTKDGDDEQSSRCTDKLPNGISACLNLLEPKHGVYELSVFSQDKTIQRISFEHIGIFSPLLMIQQADLDANQKAETVIALFDTISNGIPISYWDLYVLNDTQTQLSEAIGSQSYEIFGGLFQAKGISGCVILNPHWELTTDSNYIVADWLKYDAGKLIETDSVLPVYLDLNTLNKSRAVNKIKAWFKYPSTKVLTCPQSPFCNDGE